MIHVIAFVEIPITISLTITFCPFQEIFLFGTFFYFVGNIIVLQIVIAVSS